MKSCDFLTENTENLSESDDISMVLNNLHTIMRVTADLEKRLQSAPELDEWIKEKIAVAKSMMVTVEDYVASQQEMGQGTDSPETVYAIKFAEEMSRGTINEEASGGATASPTIAVSMQNLGEMPDNIIRRQKAYTNQMTKGGPVKIKKAK